MANARFRPVRGLEEKILQGKYQEGFVYFATDTGNIFIDAQGIARIPMGGRGAAIIYANATFVQNSGDDYYTFYMDELENPDDKLKIGDLVIAPTANGNKIARVSEINIPESKVEEIKPYLKLIKNRINKNKYIYKNQILKEVA